MTQEKAGKGETFEVALERLEAIVKEMEGGKLGLEKMIERFEEGRTLIGTCTKKLNEVERRIEVLVGEGDTVTTKPFSPDAPESGSTPPPDDAPF